MRIISGKWRGRRITAPDGGAVRPTGDRVRESWMSVVHQILPDARVLDLCAGSGALGLEALSRGAASCDFVEQSPKVLAVLQDNLEKLGGHPAAQRLPVGAYDVAFADPPYSAETVQQLVNCWMAVPFANVFGIEHSSSVILPALGETRRYGSTSLTFFRAPS